ncbi:MAG: hypothetical protein K2W82_14905 [Candidatus Obscuribacterales bacterium]|jgi:hypothetical protein|nr:hypothetical protein [Candidatus Obscuribacterales bacterium]
MEPKGFDAPAPAEDQNKQLQQPTEKQESKKDSTQVTVEQENKEREQKQITEAQDGAKNQFTAEFKTVGQANLSLAATEVAAGRVTQSVADMAQITGKSVNQVEAALAAGIFDPGDISKLSNRDLFKRDKANNKETQEDKLALLDPQSLKSNNSDIVKEGAVFERAFKPTESEPRERTEKLNGERDIDPAKDNLPATVKNYEDFLKRSGVPAGEAADKSKQLESFLNKSNEDLHNPEIAKHLQGTPEQEMARMCKAMNEVMESREGPLTQTDRANLVMGMAARSADAETYGNQGQHKTCALESLSNTQMTTRRAEELEKMASVANKGGAYVGEGEDRHWVGVNEASRIPDFESNQEWNAAVFGNGGQRSMTGQMAEATGGGQRDLAGQLSDALYGQLAADLETSRLRASGQIGKNQSLEYFAAHLDTAGAGYKAGQDSTNEGQTLTTKTEKGLRRELVNAGVPDSKPSDSEGPQVGAWQVAELHTRATGQQGGVFVSEAMLSMPNGLGKKPAGMGDDVKLSTFTDQADHQRKLAQYEAETGQSAQILVNAPYLKGGGMNGHGLHAMSESTKNGQIQLDNQWGGNADKLAHSMNAADIDKATNPAHWSKNQPDWSREKLDPDSNRETRDKLQDDKDKDNKDEKDRKAEIDRRTLETRMAQWREAKSQHDYEQQRLLSTNKDHRVKPFDQEPPSMLS